MFRIRRFGRGFTLVELLVVISIIGVMVGLLLPAVQSAREAARSMQCQNNLRQLGLAVHNFESAYKCLPPARVAPRPGDVASFQCGGEQPNWIALVLPFMEEQKLTIDFDRFGNWYEQPDRMNTWLPTLICPSRRGAFGPLIERTIGGGSGGRLPCGCPIPGQGNQTVAGIPTDYAGNHGDLSPGAVGLPTDFYYGGNGSGAMNTVRPICADGKMIDYAEQYRFRDIIDGLSNTFLAGEKHIPINSLGKFPYDGPAYDGDHLPAGSRIVGPGVAMGLGPYDDDANFYAFGSWHPGRTHFIFCDLSTRAIRAETDTVTLSQLANRRNSKVEKIFLD